jgi:VanZ family protein
LACVAAFLLCTAFILLVKYAQLFFPPRTVTINYVIAQSLGAGVGIALLTGLRSPLGELGRGGERLEGLHVMLSVYTGLLIAFMLMPLDFALNAEDLTAQLNKLPDTVTSFGDPTRPFSVRFAMLVSGIAATAPVGALLTLMRRGRIYVGRSTSAASWMGFFAMVGVYALTALVMSGAASLPAVGFRTIGIALGAWFMHWLTRQDPNRLHNALGDLVPSAALIYLVILVAVNGLLSLDWTAPRDYGNAMLPLYNYYIVTKAQAAKSIMGHVVMYAPIGIMVWLRAKRGGRAIASFVAVILAAAIEGARSLNADLIPDINAIPLAGLSAWLSASLMPPLWRMLSSAALGRTVPIPLQPSQFTAGVTPVGWRDRAAQNRARRRDQGRPIGPVADDIEDY